MAVLSKPVVLGSIAITLGLSWAAWYDNYRRTRPDYKQKLVDRRKQELTEQREANDPTNYVKKIPLVEDCLDQMKVSEYTMKHIQIGEGFMEKNEMGKAAAHIAAGLAYMDGRQIAMTLQQLAMTLPQQLIQAIQMNLKVAKGRAQTQYLEAFAGAKKKTTESMQEKLAGESAPVITEVPAVENQETTAADLDKLEDDSIDGDSEEAKITEIIEDVDNVDELVEDSITEEKPTETLVGVAVERKQVEQDEPIDCDSLDGDSEQVPANLDGAGDNQSEEEEVEQVESHIEQLTDTIKEDVEPVVEPVADSISDDEQNTVVDKEDEVIEISSSESGSEVDISNTEQQQTVHSNPDSNFEEITDSMVSSQTAKEQPEIVNVQPETPRAHQPEQLLATHESPQVILASGDVQDFQQKTSEVDEEFYSPEPSTKNNRPKELIEEHVSEALEADE